MATTFTDRLTSDWVRFGVAVGVAIVLAGLVWSFVGRLASIPTFFGAAWLVWQAYTTLLNVRPAHLFTGEPSVTELYTDYVVKSPLVLLLILAIAIAAMVFFFAKKNKQNEQAPILVRIIVGVAAGSGVLVLAHLILNFVQSR